MKQIEESIVCMKWIKESKMALLRRNGEILIYKWQANVISPTNRIPFLCSIERERKVERVKKSVFDPQEYYDLSLNISSFPAEFIGSHTLCLGGFPDGKFVVIEFDNEGSELYQGHSFTVCCLKTDPKENFLITGDISGGVIVWHIQASGYNCKLAKKHSFRDQKAQISSIFVSV